jgi:hypothetical protein
MLSRSSCGRRCTHVDANGVRCITRLCYLNPGSECYVHAALRQEIRQRPAVVEMERLMRQVDERDRISA